MRKRPKQIWVTEEEKEAFQRLQEQCDKHNIPLTVVKRGWSKTSEGTVSWENPAYRKPDEVDYFQVRDATIAEMKQYAPKYKKIDREIEFKGNMAFISLADFHFNKLCEVSVSGNEYNLDIAMSRLEEGLANLLAMSQGFGVERYVLVIGNDMLNSDTPKGTTTAGTHQDNDKHWTTAYRVAKEGLIFAVETLVQYADVHIIHCPSNHDYQMGWALADCIASWFSKHPNVTSDVSIRHRKYYQWGLNMIETDHGDKHRAADIAGIMAEEQAELWGKTKHRYSYKHHIHHKDAKVYQKTKEYVGVTVEHIGSPSPSDEWHDGQGYIGDQVLELFLHNKERGRFGSFNYKF